MARFVGLAIEELEVELVACVDVAAAVGALAQSSFALIITDLMLPGESGLGLLQRLRDTPLLRGEALVTVFSAGLNTETRAELANYPVWRMLSKPISVTALIACVEDALHGINVATPVPQEASLGAQDTGDAQQAAIRDHFAGDAELFRDYRQACLAQFGRDIECGDAACATQDLQALRRLAHSLKTVLLTLGEPEAGAIAAELEHSAAAGDAPAALAGWWRLRARLA